MLGPIDENTLGDSVGADVGFADGCTVGLAVGN